MSSYTIAEAAAIMDVSEARVLELQRSGTLRTDSYDDALLWRSDVEAHRPVADNRPGWSSPRGANGPLGTGRA